MSNGKVAWLVNDGSIQIKEFPEPEVKDDGILIEIGLAGICGTDVHIVQNYKNFAAGMPMVLGHEISGKIVQIGKNAHRVMHCDDQLKVGDKIVLYDFLPCNNCFMDNRYGTDYTVICEAPLSGYCDKGDEWPHFKGGYGDYFYIQPGTYIWKVPENMEWERAVLTEPFSMGIRAVEKAISIPSWKNMQTLTFGGVVVVLGAGAIGILTAIAAKIAGAGTVILSGGPEKNLKLAKQINAADEVINIFDTTPAQRLDFIRSLTPGGRGADAVFSAAGVPVAFKEGLSMVRKLGTFVEMGCLIDDGKTIDINVARDIVGKDINMYGVVSQPPQTFTKSLVLLDRFSKTYDFGKIVTDIFEVPQADAALKLAMNEKNKGIKVAIKGKAYSK
jgi:threonine dehydrogenase-like Zn-dependent dehydrogenase